MLGEKLPRICVVPPGLGAAIVKADCARLRVEPALSTSQYIAHALNSGAVRKQARDLIHGVGRPRLGLKWLRGLLVPVAPLSEQARIVDAIDSYFTRLDNAAATLERVQRNLQRYRASVLKAAVEGRLVPTEAALARAEGRSYEPADELLKRVLAVRRRRWEAECAKFAANGNAPRDSGCKPKYVDPTPPDTCDLPALPEGWTWASWAQIGSSQNGRSFPSHEYASAGVRLLRPGNLHKSGHVEWTTSNTRCMPVSWEARFPGYVVGPGELVMNLTAQSLKDDFLGRICITGPADRCLLNQRLARLSSAVISPRFLLWWFRTPVFRRFVASLNTGSLIQHMFTSQLDNHVFPLPPLTEQGRIQTAIERDFEIADCVERDIEDQLRRLGHLKQSVVRWAFEGRLVDHDPSDDPASVLLERIRTERDAVTPWNVGVKSRRTEVIK